METKKFNNKERKRTRCEVYSRVVGYLRPIDSFNPGKLSEFRDRKTFNINNKKDGKNKNTRP
jgi:anaerobic ribonucleoside-triphosphate reductase